MIFGNKELYAIEVYHEPLNDYNFYMTGRMCLHLGGVMVGDIKDSGCSLHVAYSRLIEVIAKIDNLKSDFYYETDEEIFNFLDMKLYIGDDSISDEQVEKDFQQYFKYDFLTASGEMFCGTKSFIYLGNNEDIHILFHIYNKDKEEKFGSIQVDKKIFLDVTNEFIEWYEMTWKIKQ